MTREEYVIQAISNGETETFLKEIELTDSVPGIDTYAALLEIILQFLERSGYHERVGALLIEKGIRQNLLPNLAEYKIRSYTFVKTIKQATPHYGIFTSNVLRRIILQILRNSKNEDSRLFLDFLPLAGYQDINNFFFNRFVENEVLNSNGMSLLYTCISDIQNSHAILLKDVRIKMREKLKERNSLVFYLKNFLRPYWNSSGRTVDEDYWYVPEPFWLQIFRSAEDFLLFIRDQQPQGELLELEIEMRNIVFLLAPNYQHFDSRNYRLNRNLHINLRKEDMYNWR